MYTRSERLSLLLQWCRAVCALYGMKINNFTVSFSDGRALCYLVHHYHPGLLPRDRIQTQTTLTYRGSAGGNSDDSDSDDSFDTEWTRITKQGNGVPTVFEELLSNEKENFKLLYEKVGELGGIPFMARHADMSNTIPDEKVVITFVTYLCSRLLDIRQEVRAARVIQAAWRQHHLRKHRHRYEIQIHAAIVIQRQWRLWLSRRCHEQQLAAIMLLQRQWRCLLARRSIIARRAEKQLAKEDAAARRIQRCARTFLVKLHHRRCHLSATTVQAAWRSYCVRKELRQKHAAAVIIQHWFKGHQLTTVLRQQYVTMRKTVVLLQSVVRRYLARKLILRMRAAIKIQAAYRMSHKRRAYQDKREKVSLIASWWRMIKERQRFLQLRNSVLRIQERLRAHLVCRRQREHFMRIRAATIIIQRCYREKKVAEHQRFLSAAITLQAWYRGVQQRRKYIKLKKTVVYVQRQCRATTIARHQLMLYHVIRGATITIQTWVRRFLVKHRLLGLHRAATKIQACYRRHVAMTRYLKQRESCVKIQQWFRAVMLTRAQESEDYITKCLAATKIKAFYRGYAIRRQCKKQQEACLVIQEWFRNAMLARAQRSSFNLARLHATRIQAFFRGIICRCRYLALRNTAVCIQSHRRMVTHRRHFLAKRGAAQVIQQQWRAWRMSRQVARAYQAKRRSATIIQAAFRGHQARCHTKQIRAAICIQAFWRSCQQRETYLKQRQSVIRIQSCVRRRQQRIKYETLRRAAIIIQHHWRTVLLSRIQQQWFQIMNKAATTLQAGVRGWLQRRRYLYERVAVIRAQAAVRSYLCRAELGRRKWALAVLQTRWRAVLLGREKRQLFLGKKQAAILLQAAYRGRRQQMKYHTIKCGITKFQAVVKKNLQQHRYRVLQGATRTIQQRFRAKLVGRQVRASYEKQYKAVILIQSYTRGFFARRIAHTIRAAVIIQKHWRMAIARAEYVKMKSGFTTLQAVVKARCQRKDYLLKRAAACVIQKRFRETVRTRQVKDEYKRVRNAVITIQSMVRGSIARQQVRKIRAVITFQKQWRMKHELLRYRRERAAIIMLQSQVRRLMVQKQFHRTVAAATLLQRKWRAVQLMRQDLKRYHIQVGAAITIQCTYKAYRERCRFLRLRSGFIQFQALIRGKLARQIFLRQQRAAQTIQRWFRAVTVGQAMRREFCRQTAAILFLQSVVRGYHARKYVQKIKAAIMIQKHWRMIQEKQLYNTKKAAAIRIQSHVRKFSARQEFLQKKTAAVIIQRRFRATLAMFKARRSYHILMGAAITLQAAFKARKQRITYRKQKEGFVRLQAEVRRRNHHGRFQNLRCAAIVLQSKYRAWKAAKIQRQEFVRMRCAATIIQSHYREAVNRRQVMKIQAAILIQSWWKTMTQKKRFHRIRAAAVIVQSNYRRALATRKFDQLKAATLVIQRRVRANLMAWDAQREYHKKRGAIITIQATCKAYQQRKRFRNLQQGVTRCQAEFRRRQQQRKYQQLRRAACRIQERFRATLKAKEAQIDYLRLLQASVSIQRAYRKLVAKRLQQQSTAATTIQSVWRAFIAQRAYSKEKCAVVIIQSFMRMMVCRRRYLRLSEAVQIIQVKWKAELQKRQALCRYAAIRQACIRIQAWYRMVLQRRMYLSNIEKVIKIQAIVRGRLDRVKYRRIKLATAVLQKNLRVYHKRRSLQREYERTCTASLVLQRHIRGFLVRRNYQRLRAAVFIQKHWRMVQERKHYRTLLWATCKMQANYRARAAVKDFRKQREATLCLQTHMRAVIVGRKTRQEFMQRRSCICRIQKWWRQILITRHQRQAVAATRIQAFIRMRQERQCYLKIKSKITHIQSAFRGWQTKQRYKVRVMENNAAKIIQSAYRRHLALKYKQEYLRRRQAYIAHYTSIVHRHLCVVRLQRAWRRHRLLVAATHQMAAVLTIQHWLRGRLERIRYLRLCQSVCVFQRASRRYLCRKHLAATRIQQAVRVWLVHRRAVRRERAVISIQSLWRGFCVRRRVKDKKVKRVRQRIAEATRKATDDMKLCNRTRSALDYLLQCKQLALVLEAVMNLDASTRLSSRCCEWMVAEDAQTVLYTLIRGCNRSLPHMEIIKYTVNIFLNLAKYEKTREAVYRVPDSIDTLLELMMIYRDKGAIFTKTCTLLGILCNDPVRRREVLAMPKSVERIQSLHALTSRKHKMEEQRARVKSKMAASKCPGIPKLTPTKHLRLSPAWYARRDSLTQIDDPLQAINFVLANLRLAPK